MSILDLFSLQGTLFAMMLIGAWLKKRGIVDNNGKKCLTDLCVNMVIPCNIFKSCLIEFNMGIFKSCAMLLLSAVILQCLCLTLNKFIFNRYAPQQKKVLKNVLTHPCLVAIYLGLICMVTQVKLPSVITETVRYIGSCNSALTMFIVGTILADVKLPTIVNRHTITFSVFRLAILPAIALGLGRLLGLDNVSLGISVLMTGMPAGATAAIFAARYGSDAPFATKCVVMSTLLSMLTLPLWCYLVG